MSRVFHISRERYDRIRSQGWSMPLPKISDEQASILLADPTTNVYHFLDADVSECSLCGVVVHGLIAETPVELETAKLIVKDPMNCTPKPSSDGEEK